MCRYIGSLLCSVLMVIICSSGSLALVSDFVLGPGDVLQISVWKEEMLTREVRVRPDGKISFPLVGDVLAAGKTVPQIQQELQKHLKKYVPDNPVTVILSQLRSLKVYVVGKVLRPGQFVLDEKITVLQALALAGGLNKFADKNDILVLRWKEGRQVSLRFDYSKVSKGQDLSSNHILKPGDTILVP